MLLFPRIILLLYFTFIYISAENLWEKSDKKVVSISSIGTVWGKRGQESTSTSQYKICWSWYWTQTMDIRSRNFPQIKSKIFLGLLRQMRLAVLLFVSSRSNRGNSRHRGNLARSQGNADTGPWPGLAGTKLGIWHRQPSASRGEWAVLTLS